MEPYRSYTCPLCSNAFGSDGEACHSSCPMSKGCNMIKCPRCNYEFVEDSSIVNLFRKLAGKWREMREDSRS